MKKQSPETKKLNKIISDNTSGSTDLLLKLNELILDNRRNKSKLKKILSESEKSFKEFQIIKNYTFTVQKFLSENDVEGLSSYLEEVKHSPASVKDIYTRAKEYLKGITTVLTLSFSRTISEFLQHWQEDQPELKIIIAESRPNFEGRKLAKVLLKNKIKVELITDASIGIFIPVCDSVLIGADSILENGNVINKTGSLAAAVLCREAGKPFFVAAQKEKFSSGNLLSQTEKSADEVWKKKDKNLIVRNYYFEEIPKKYITRIFS